MKKCSKCKQWLNKKHFNKDATRKDGFEYRCKACSTTRYQIHKEEAAVRKKKWRQKNPERCIWQNMINRCTNPKNISYKYHGGRGLKSFTKISTNSLLM